MPVPELSIWTARRVIAGGHRLAGGRWRFSGARSRGRSVRAQTRGGRQPKGEAQCNEGCTGMTDPAQRTVAMAGAVVYRLAFTSPPPQSTPGPTVGYVERWEGLLGEGRQVGNPEAKVQLIEFIDLQCPGCRALGKTLGALQTKYGTKLGVTLIHYPLEMHKSARDAARIAECGVSEGRFAELVDVILESQDSLGSVPRSQFGEPAKIRDKERFASCVLDSAHVEMIDRGLKAGEEIGVRATPTVIVNGWRFTAAPTHRELEVIIDAMLEGAPPPFTVR